MPSLSISSQPGSKAPAGCATLIGHLMIFVDVLKIHIALSSLKTGFTGWCIIINCSVKTQSCSFDRLYGSNISNQRNKLAVTTSSKYENLRNMRTWTDLSSSSLWLVGWLGGWWAGLAFYLLPFILVSCLAPLSLLEPSGALHIPISAHRIKLKYLKSQT